MPNFWEVVNKVIRNSDVVLHIVDARLPQLSQNQEICSKLHGKKSILVLNKCDLLSRKALDRLRSKFRKAVFISARDKLGTTILKRRILELGAKDTVIVGVVGYPNTGKSSVVNALAGKGKAKTSPESGYTKGFQYISAGRIKLMDTPGVIPFKDDDEYVQSIIGARDFTQVKDPEYVALRLIEDMQDMISEHYGIKRDDPDVMLELIAKKKHLLAKGGVPDTEKASRMLLKDWQRGKIRQA